MPKITHRTAAPTVIEIVAESAPAIVGSTARWV